MKYLFLLTALSLSLYGQSAGTVTHQVLGVPAYYCADAGSTDAYACNITPPLDAYREGTHYTFEANTANTGAATINLNSLGAKTIKKVSGSITTDLDTDDIRVGQVVDLVYDGTNMQMQSTLGNSVTPITPSSGDNAATIQAILTAGNIAELSAGTYNVGSALTITASHSGIRCLPGAIIQYNGVGDITAIVSDNGSTNSVVYYGQTVQGCTILGNSHSDYAVQINSAHQGIYTGLTLGNVTNACMSIKFAVGNNYDVRCTNNSVPGEAFDPTPVNGIEVSGVNTTYPTVAGAARFLVSGVSGTGIAIDYAESWWMTGYSEYSGTGVTISTNARRVTLGPSFHIETNSVADLVDLGRYTTLISTSSNGTTTLGGQQARILGGMYSILAVADTATLTLLDGMQYTTFSDAGNRTQRISAYEANATARNTADNLKDYSLLFDTSLDTVRAGNLPNIGNVDAQEVLRGRWQFSTTPTVLSATVYTVAKPWRALFIGVWQNAVEGGGMAQFSTLVEATSVANTITVGSVVLTISVNGSTGKLEAVTGSSYIGFQGTIYFVPNNVTLAGTASILLKGDISTSGSLTGSKVNTVANCSSAAAPAVCAAASAGSVVVAAAATSVVVNTTAVTANSQVLVTFDSSLGTKLGVTCNTTPVQPTVSARTAATSFTLTVPTAPDTNPACFSYSIIN